MLLALAWFGCSVDGDENDPAVDGDVTWHQNVAPIVQEHCVGCHAEGKIAPFALDTPEAAAPMAALMAYDVENGLMPPWLAVETPECKPTHPWAEDRRLSAEEIATISAWAAAGAPVGDPATAAALPEPEEVGIASPDAVIPFQSAFTVSGDRDIFQCFVIDLPNTEEMWIESIQLQPGNPVVDHHGLVYLAADPAEIAALPVGPDGSFPCFNPPQVSGYLAATWVPGSSPTTLPPDTGMVAPVGSKLIVQMHYHPASTPQEDLSSIELTWSSSKPTWAAAQALVGNNDRQQRDGYGLQPGPNDRGAAEFFIPAGATGHTETMRILQEISYDFPVFSVGTHMHYVGTGMRIEVEHTGPSTPGTECLIETPRWDFNWQRVYRYDAPIDQLPKINQGDVIQLTCDFNNSLDNPFVADALAQDGLSSPQDVTLGEQTTDEMCLGLFGFLVPSAFVDALL
jgi:mono/diheme cytochrome c family protein